MADQEENVKRILDNPLFSLRNNAPPAAPPAKLTAAQRGEQRRRAAIKRGEDRRKAAIKRGEEGRAKANK